MTVIDERLRTIEHVTLAKGAHRSLDSGACLLELSSYLAGEPWSDHPQCVSPVLGAFGRAWNDTLDDETRQRLKPYAARLVGTRSTPEVESRRSWMACLIPHREKWRERRDGPSWGFYRMRTTGPEPGKPVYRWWRPAGWHLRLAGREYGLGRLATIWHVEPKGHDSGEICKHWKNNKPHGAWRWHVHHWHIQIHFVQRLHRKLFERCTLCGRPYPWGYAPVSHQWDEPRGRWWHVERRAYHHECSASVSRQRMIDQDVEIIRALVAYLGVVTDKSEAELVNHLCDYRASWADFHVRYQLQGLLGYEHDEGADDGSLVKARPRGRARAASEDTKG